MKKPLIEVLETANGIKDAEDRASFLRLHMRETIKKVLASIHNPAIKFDSFAVNYSTRNNKIGIADTTLENELKRLYIFETACPLALKRKETRLIQILEGLYNEEADLLFMYILNKLNPYDNINKSFLKKYFPDILTTTLTKR
jgi:hypothetical protein